MTESAEEPEARRGLPPVDKAKLHRTMRGVFSALLILQALVVLLVPRTIAQFGVGLTGFRLTSILVLAGLLIALCAFIKKPWAYAAGWVLQVATLALGFWVGTMFFLGAIFALMWFYAGKTYKELKARPDLD